MKTALWYTYFAVFVHAATAVAHQNNDIMGGSPVSKVIRIMELLLQKAKLAKNQEQIQFTSYKQFCTRQQQQKSSEIEDGSNTADILRADIEVYAAKARRATKKIGELQTRIDAWNADIKAAAKLRSGDKAEYGRLHDDYSESLDALETAVNVLKTQDYKRPGRAFLQLRALKARRTLEEDAEGMIDSFLAGAHAQEGAAMEAPEANAYEFQSAGIINLLEKLHGKFQNEIRKIESEEQLLKQSYDLMVKDIKTNIKTAQQDLDATVAAKATYLTQHSRSKGAKRETEDMKKSDQSFATDLINTCEQKRKDYTSRQQLRDEEIAAIGKALEIIASEAVSGNARKHLPSMLDVHLTSLVLTKARKVDARRSSRSKEHVAAFLRAQAKKLSSRVLSTVVDRALADPFGKVKNMIKELIVKLMEQANADTEHKGWCDKELSTNKKTRKEKTQMVETLQAQVEELEASIAKLTENMANLSKQIQELDRGISDATELRSKEKAKNMETIQDAVSAQSAVNQALAVLRHFYEKAGEATALSQQPSDSPKIFDAPFQGMSGEGGGVIGMLEVIQADFARLESETQSSETAAQDEYARFMSEVKANKAEKAQESDSNAAKKQDDTDALASAKDDLEGTQNELAAAIAFSDKLKPSCINSGVSFEDRTARRKAELESLKQALEIMQGESV